jgi:type IV pilus assembly protein PilA
MKKTNKGFSLVELIIVIAIMAILAGAIAPALIKYIDKSRKSNDVSSAKTIKTAVETALGTESVYELLVNTQGSTLFVFPNQPTSALSSYSGIDSAIMCTINSGGVNPNNGVSLQQAATLIGSNIGEKTPKIKYKKSTSGVTPTNFFVTINNKGTVAVGVTSASSGTITVIKGTVTTGNAIELAPDLDEDYQ